MTEPREEPYPFPLRTRVLQEADAVAVIVDDRMRHADRQGDAASPRGLCGELRALADAEKEARFLHGPQKTVALGHVRRCYLNIAATSVLLAERATRPVFAP